MILEMYLQPMKSLRRGMDLMAEIFLGLVEEEEDKEIRLLITGSESRERFLYKYLIVKAWCLK